MLPENPAAAPDWAKDAVWYQIFPERFRNGAPQSNPQAEDVGAERVPGWAPCRWEMEWYGRADWEKTGGKPFWGTVFHRRFGGDLVGLRQKLDYLQDLGINAIYLNPIFQSPSLHKYDATCYHHVDPTLGPDRDGDMALLAKAQETEKPDTWVWTAADRYFLELVADVHSRGMRIILDGVFNHSGTRCFAFQDLLRNGRASRYADWYSIKEWRADGSFEHVGWFGHASLPEFGRTEENLHAGVKQYVFDCTRRWMDPSGEGRPEMGIDGWRLDVAFCVPHGFWREWHGLVRSINPAAYTTAEIVGPAQEWIRADEFPAVMNYEWAYPSLSFFTPHAEAIAAEEFRQRIDALHGRHEPGTAFLMQNLYDSHDTGRVLTLFEGPCPPFATWDPYFNWPRVGKNAGLRTHRPGADAREAYRLAAAWQMAGPGAPMIYYGTEVGMWGGNDPCDRQPMFWADVPAEDETQGFEAPLPRANSRTPDTELFAFVRRLIALRHAHAALRRGSFRWLEAPGPDTLHFERAFEGETIRCLIHRGKTPVRSPPLPASAENLWDGSPIPEELAPRSFLLVRLGAG